MHKDREEIEEKPRKRRKRKSRFGYYLYAVVMLLLTIANIIVATFLLTFVQRIDISETTYVQKSQILQWFKEDPYTLNSIYAVAKHKMAPPETPAYLERVKVGWSAPWAIKIDVQEKQIVGCILFEETYLYFAKDGTVMLKGSQVLEGLPIIEGLEADEAALYGTLTFEDEKVFSYVVNISEQIKKNELNPDRLVWEEDSMNLYFGEIRVCLGKLNFDEKLVELPPILGSLEGKKGTLHLEHYSEMSTNISFVEDKDLPVIDEPETPEDTPETSGDTSETPEDTNENTSEGASTEGDSAEG